MVGDLQGIGKIPELKRRLLVTFVLLGVYRVGAHVPVPGIDDLLLMVSDKPFGFIHNVAVRYCIARTSEAPGASPGIVIDDPPACAGGFRGRSSAR